VCNRQAASWLIVIGWPAYRVVGKRLALASKSAGQRTKRIFRRFLAYEQNGEIHGISNNTCCYVIVVNLLHRCHCFLLTRWRRLLRLSNWVNWACLLRECAMFMSSAVLVMLHFKRIASIPVISQPYVLQNGASVRWPAACWLHAPRPWLSHLVHRLWLQPVQA